MNTHQKEPKEKYMIEFFGDIANEFSILNKDDIFDTYEDAFDWGSKQAIGNGFAEIFRIVKVYRLEPK